MFRSIPSVVVLFYGCSDYNNLNNPHNQLLVGHMTLILTLKFWVLIDFYDALMEYIIFSTEHNLYDNKVSC